MTNQLVIESQTITSYSKQEPSQEDRIKVNNLINFLGLNKDNVFGLHEASRKLVYHKDNFSAFLEGRDHDITPISVEVVPSIRCNFNCPSCTYGQNGSKYFFSKRNNENPNHNGFMNFETFESVISDLLKLGTKSVIITGGGEPSMNPNYVEFMRYLKSKGLEFGLYSNACLIGKDLSSILELNPTFIRLSLNSGDERTHELMYGKKAMFKRVLENIILAGKIKQVMPECKTTIGLGFIMGPRNSCDNQLDSIEQTLRHIDETCPNGIDYAAFRPEVQYFNLDKLTGKSEICKQQPNKNIFQSMFERIQERVALPLANTNLKILIAKEGFEYLSEPYQDESNIASPWSVSVNYDGLGYMASEANGNPDYCFSLNPEIGLYYSWHSQKKEEIRQCLASNPLESNHMSMFAHYKLLSSNNFLKAIRERFGKFTEAQVELFYDLIDLSKPVDHVNFI